MARACTVCGSSRRAEIELSASNGTPFREIARRYAVGHDAVQRHMAAHVKQAAKEHLQRIQEAETLDVLAQLVELNRGTWDIWRACKGNKKLYGMALSASDRITRQLELYAKLRGDLAPSTQINIQLPAPWSEIELAIAGALSAYPDAAVEVADALARMEVGRAGLN